MPLENRKMFLEMESFKKILFGSKFWPELLGGYLVSVSFSVTLMFDYGMLTQIPFRVLHNTQHFLKF